MRILAALAIAGGLGGCAWGPEGVEVNWREAGRGWVDSVCRQAESASDYCRSRGYPSPGLGRY
jgi:hypothetical protein